MALRSELTSGSPDGMWLRAIEIDGDAPLHLYPDCQFTGDGPHVFVVPDAAAHLTGMLMSARCSVKVLTNTHGAW